MKTTAKQWGLYEGQLLAMIHSGSRGLGHQVCSEHSRKFEQNTEELLMDGMLKNTILLFQTDN